MQSRRRRFFFACREMGFSFHVFLFFSYSISSSKLDFRMIRLKDIAQVKKIKAIKASSEGPFMNHCSFIGQLIVAMVFFSFQENFQRSLFEGHPLLIYYILQLNRNFLHIQRILASRVIEFKIKHWQGSKYYTGLAKTTKRIGKLHCFDN